MCESSLHGDGVEVLFERVQLSDHLHPILAADFLFNRSGTRENSVSILSERFKRHAVIELADDVERQFAMGQPRVQQLSEHRVGCRQKYRRTL